MPPFPDQASISQTPLNCHPAFFLWSPNRIQMKKLDSDYAQQLFQKRDRLKIDGKNSVSTLGEPA
ncbi:MAG: hypothetical protein KME13_05140 [Myxacorys californica WJT36-NPBG1]|nr:hypothetical protein [Myxacorys californica WJT36-NPBG1]